MLPCDHTILTMHQHQLEQSAQRARRVHIQQATRSQAGQRLINATGRWCLRLGARLAKYGDERNETVPSTLVQGH